MKTFSMQCFDISEDVDQGCAINDFFKTRFVMWFKFNCKLKVNTFTKNLKRC